MFYCNRYLCIILGEKPFKCTHCEYSTAQNSTLKIHLKRHHGGSLSLECTHCGKHFPEKTQLLWHKQEHVQIDSSVVGTQRPPLSFTSTASSQSTNAIGQLATASSTSTVSSHLANPIGQLPTLPSTSKSSWHLVESVRMILVIFRWIIHATAEPCSLSACIFSRNINNLFYTWFGEFSKMFRKVII